MAEEASAVNQSGADTPTTDSAAVGNQESFEDAIVVNDDEQEAQDAILVEDEEAGTEEVSDKQTDDTTDEEADESETEDTEQDPQTEEPQYSKAEQRKEQLNTEIRQMVESKRQLEQELQQMQQSQRPDGQPLTEEAILNEVNPNTGEYFTPTEAQVVLMQQQIHQMQQQSQQQQYESQVSQAQTRLAQDIEGSLKDYPMFNSESKEFNKPLADRARVFIEANLVKDQSGRIVSTNMPVRDILSTLADIQSSSVTVGEAKARQATNKMLSAADVASGRTEATKPKSDPFEAGFESESYLW